MRLHTTILLTVTLIACSACASPSELWWGMFGQKIEEDVSALPDGVHTLHYSKSTPYPHWGGRKWGRGMVKDGEMTGYDLDLIRRVADAVSVPVIAAGGARDKNDLKAAVKDAGASAAAAGAMFVFQGKHRAVLISYPGSKER